MCIEKQYFIRNVALKLRETVNNHNTFKIIGHSWAALSATGRFSTHLWPQKGSGKVVDPVKAVKSSLLAGTLWKRKWRARRSLSSCHIVKPAFTALCRVWSPQLPTFTSWAPYSSACSFWRRSPNFKLTLGPSILTETSCLIFSFATHPCELTWQSVN